MLLFYRKILLWGHLLFTLFDWFRLLGFIYGWNNSISSHCRVHNSNARIYGGSRPRVSLIDSLDFFYVFWERHIHAAIEPAVLTHFRDCKQP